MRELLRSRFPALRRSEVFAEHAGGTCVPVEVAEAPGRYLRESNVQLGAGYRESDLADASLADAHALADDLFGRPGAILGASSTALVRLIAEASGKRWRTGDEVVVALNNHEANAGPWHELAERGIRVVEWAVDPDTLSHPPETLTPLLTERTRLVALGHVSNLLGQVEDARAVADLAHAAGTRVFLDSVAYAPHRALDADALGADFVVASLYKVHGPHLGALSASPDALAELDAPGWFFKPRDGSPDLWEPGSVPHELGAAWAALRPYLALVAGHDAYHGRETLTAAWRTFAELEREPHRVLVDGLLANPKVRLIGQRGDVVPTVSFVVDGWRPAAFAAACQREGVWLRSGHMYAVRLLRSLGRDPAAGVVRASLVHLNTPEEAARIVETVERITRREPSGDERA